jgi:hypothetical protein
MKHTYFQVMHSSQEWERFIENSPLAELFEKANEILGFVNHRHHEGTAEELKETKATSCFLHSVILANLGDDFKPEMVAGHSLENFSALLMAHCHLEDNKISTGSGARKYKDNRQLCHGRQNWLNTHGPLGQLSCHGGDELVKHPN